MHTHTHVYMYISARLHEISENYHDVKSKRHPLDQLNSRFQTTLLLHKTRRESFQLSHSFQLIGCEVMIFKSQRE